MDPAVDERLSRILERRRQEKAAVGPPQDHPDYERRLARNRVIAELPRLAAKISDAAAELNKIISEEDLWIKIEIEDRTPSAEAYYNIGVIGRDEDGPTLSLIIDYQGNIRSMLRSRDNRSLLGTSSIFSIERPELMAQLVSLLEVQYQSP